MNQNDDQWKRLVNAAKSAPHEDQSAPPPSVSIKTLRESVQSILLALTWRRLSMIAALLAGLVFLIFFFLREDPPLEEPIIPSDPPLAPSAP